MNTATRLILCASLLASAFMAKSQKPFITKSAAFIAVGDTVKQTETNTALSQVFITRNELEAFFKDPVLRVTDLRLDQNNVAGKWEHLLSEHEITSFMLGLIMSDNNVSMTCLGNTVNAKMISAYELNKSKCLGLTFSGIMCQNKKTEKYIAVKDLVLYVKPDVRVACENLDMPHLIYTGYDNKLNVAVNGVWYNSDVIFEGNGVEVKKETNGILTVRTNASGSKSILVKHKGKNIDTLKLEAVELPVPKMQLNDFDSGSMRSIAEILSAVVHVHSGIMYPQLARMFDVSRFTFTVWVKDKPKVFTCTGPKISGEALTYLQEHAKHAERVELSDIDAKGPNGALKLEPVTYNIRK